MTVKLDAIGIVVSDMAAAMAFYRRLGLEFVMGDENETHTEANGPGDLRIMFDTEESVQSFSEWHRPTGSHRVALAFLCESPQEVDRMYSDLTTSGGRPHLDPFDAFWGQRYATVLDADGNAVDLFASLPTD
jgi:catechol 2,3-dioxygenase-like lactoylglutathione lyase family enzyme